MKKLYKVLGIIGMLIGLAMMVYAWIFFYQDGTAIIQLASLYLTLSIAIVIFAIGFMIVKDKSE